MNVELACIVDKLLLVCVRKGVKSIYIGLIFKAIRMHALFVFDVAASI
jgi:hypothetical protein